MREADFFSDRAKQRAAQAVKAVEAHTSAELVIAVRRRSGDYRVVAYHFGFGVAAVVTLILLLLPQMYSVGAIVMDALAAFVLGALLCANLEPLARLMIPSKRRETNVEAAARAAFFDLGISRTGGRNGILIFVSTFERRLALLSDVGVDASVLGAGWAEARVSMQMALARSDFDGFIAAVEGLGPLLGSRMPRAADDVNELPDEVQ